MTATVAMNFASERDPRSLGGRGQKRRFARFIGLM